MGCSAFLVCIVSPARDRHRGARATGGFRLLSVFHRGAAFRVASSRRGDSCDVSSRSLISVVLETTGTGTTSGAADTGTSVWYRGRARPLVSRREARTGSMCGGKRVPVVTDMTPDSVMRQRIRAGVHALAALLLGLAFAPSAFAAPAHANFDHLTTGFELTGQHRDLPCESCHVNAMFQGTPKDCGACHGIGSLVRGTSKPANHILSSDQCGACHTPIAWNPAVNFDHTQARGSCSTCHNGTMAQGKGPTHIVTDLECDACHTTLSWAGAMFTHVGVTSGCATCHDGVHADGLAANHFPVGSGGAAVPCEACHSTIEFTTWAVATMNHPAAVALSCASCHETANFVGMHPSTDTAAGDSRPSAKLDSLHPTTGDCAQCHDTTTFSQSASRPANHIPTSAPCLQCHTTAGNYALYSVTATHQGVTGCLSCHGPSTGPFAGPPPGNTITIVGAPANHFPVGSLDCNGSGCHTTGNVNAGGFKLGTASTSSPTLTIAGHTTVAAAVSSCATCHESAPYVGMMASSATAWGDSRPQAFDKVHPATGDCNGCHTTTPTFATDMTPSAKPANHIPTTAPCTQCHTTANDYAQYSSLGTHQGLTGCLSCHGPTVATTFANITLVTTPSNHFPVATLDCNGSGCHTTSNVNAGGFKLGTASISSPTLNAAGHTTATGAGLACATCHETAPYLGMVPSTSTAAGDSRPDTTLDVKHPATGDCGACHVETPTFAINLLPTAPKPSNHVPTTAACAQCHTTAGNFALYSVTGVHQGISGCLSCHGSNTGHFAGPPPSNTITVVGVPANHFPVGSLDCNRSGCHSTSNVSPGGFKLGSASLTAPTLSVAGHTTVAAAVAACQTCHESAPYVGMMASSATAWGDSRPQAFDKVHPATGDCSGCHTTTPTFV